MKTDTNTMDTSFNFTDLDHLTEYRFGYVIGKLKEATEEFNNFELQHSEYENYEFKRDEYASCNFDMYIFDKFRVNIEMLINYDTEDYYFEINDGYNIETFDKISQFVKHITHLLVD